MTPRSPFSPTIWDEVELCSQDEVTAEHVPQLLKKQLTYVLRASPFYQEKLRGLSVPDVDDVLAFHDTLPFTEKSELLSSQNEHPPFGNYVCADAADLRRLHRTSGTTGAPLLLLLTANDVAHTYNCGARCYFASGLRPHHTVVHCMNYCLWAGGYTDHGSLETVGATVIPFGVGNSNVLIESMLRIRPDTLHSTPSYLTKLRDRLRSDFGMEPADLGLKLGLFGGEGGLQDPNFRREIESIWGFRAMDANYGMADVLSMFGAECEHRCGLHFMGQGVIHPTLLDCQTGDVIPIRTGTRGELILTSLLKEAQPVVRLRTRDVIEILSAERCPCGRGSFRFEVVGRSDDMIVVKGVNIFLGAIGRVVARHLDHLTGEYAVFVSESDPIDEIVLRVELRRGGSAGDETRQRLREALLKTLTLHVQVESVPEGSLPRTDGKTHRLHRTL